MATVKIVTLLVRTLAKPIATQLRTQAAQHDSFRRVCIGIAQRLHRVEMTLRWGLVPKAPQRENHNDGKGDGGEGGEGGEKGGGEAHHHASTISRPKVRPLNEAKAVANGAVFLSEAFLFIIAAGLILGESLRSSAKSRQQRNRTEERTEEVARAVEALGRRLGVDTGLALEEPTEQEGASGAVEEAGLETEPHTRTSVRSREEDEAVRLRKAVDVLLRMAINGGLIQGQDALDLNGIMQGNDTPSNPQPEGQAQGEPVKPGQTAATPITSSTPPSPILQQLAAHRAKQLAELSRIQAS
ncbi:hypothetical protein BCV69DRAFT_295374 [Microstroma glucosiphilum]|uniref:OPA3-domain-containing protein n=1 Tax=Pseudomicrostroma glucosiphilum TaxID=1684307 RepID=A0A316TZY1_9BASI|nr:hypothetical protein BCV69DRAFT_295374 [Pseudomicrostroma glucosiphilum]PWN18204.1 hypothetical protein BCV69DRAFT_295374 [Pseudomicrostroma glucosiphilum]